MALSSRAKCIIVAVSAAVLSLYFLMWSVQTAWLGSFPGRNLDYFTFWAVLQFSVAVILGGVSVIAVLRSRSTGRKANDG